MDGGHGCDVMGWGRCKVGYREIPASSIIHAWSMDRAGARTRQRRKKIIKNKIKVGVARASFFSEGRESVGRRRRPAWWSRLMRIGLGLGPWLLV